MLLAFVVNFNKKVALASKKKHKLNNYKKNNKAKTIVNKPKLFIN